MLCVRIFRCYLSWFQLDSFTDPECRNLHVYVIMVMPRCDAYRSMAVLKIWPDCQGISISVIYKQIGRTVFILIIIQFNMFEQDLLNTGGKNYGFKEKYAISIRHLQSYIFMILFSKVRTEFLPFTLPYLFFIKSKD